ncbi:MAG: hypothetical protein V4658_14880 [Bacteroidota bacterium]
MNFAIHQLKFIMQHMCLWTLCLFFIHSCNGQLKTNECATGSIIIPASLQEFARPVEIPYSCLPVFTSAQAGYSMGKNEQATYYSQAIAEYIKAAYKRDRSGFDTLFIGKHDDFPDITLPATIRHTNIKLLTTKEADKKLLYRRSLVYVNIIGAISKEHAHFVFVTFLVRKTSGNPMYKPKHNCDIDLNYNPAKKIVELHKIKFRNY